MKYEEITEQLHQALGHTGLALMAIAAVIGITELTDRKEIKALPTVQPSYAFAGDNNYLNDKLENSDSAIRREKEEIGHRMESYGVTMRTHAVSGKR